MTSLVNCSWTRKTFLTSTPWDLRKYHQLADLQVLDGISKERSNGVQDHRVESMWVCESETLGVT